MIDGLVFGRVSYAETGSRQFDFRPSDWL